MHFSVSTYSKFGRNSGFVIEGKGGAGSSGYKGRNCGVGVYFRGYGNSGKNLGATMLDALDGIFWIIVIKFIYRPEIFNNRCLGSHRLLVTLKVT